MTQRHRMALALALAFSASASANDELAQIRAQIEQLKTAYEQRIAALEARLAQAEATAPAPAAAAPPPGAGGRSASGFNPDVSLILQGQFRHAKEAPHGSSLGGFWPAGHEHGKRGFSLDESELVLSASVDPYWRGFAVLAVQDGEVEVEEAWAQATGLGRGMGLKVGRFRSGIGYLNEQHRHAWDFADAPLAYRALFGNHGAYAQDGLQFKWLAPTETFVELGAEIGRGAGFPGTDRNRNGSGAGAVFAHVGGDVGLAHSWRAGVSYLATRVRDRTAEAHDAAEVEVDSAFSGKSRTWLADFVWKWSPDGNPKYRNFKFQTEVFQRRETGTLSCAGAGSTLCPAGDDYRRRQSGWYAQAVYQFTPQWRTGYRYDRLHSGTARLGSSIATALAADNPALIRYNPTRHSLMVDYNWSEFSRLRLQYARDRSLPGLADHQWTLQYIMSLGAHGAHKF